MVLKMKEFVGHITCIMIVNNGDGPYDIGLLKPNLGLQNGLSHKVPNGLGPVGITFLAMSSSNFSRSGGSKETPTRATFSMIAPPWDNRATDIIFMWQLPT